MVRKQKVLELLKKGWIFLVAAGAVILSTVILAVSIHTMQSRSQSYTEDTALSDAHTTDEQGWQQGSASNDFFDMPKYVLAFDRSNENPTEKDISMEQAAELAAILLMQLLEADLDGEICHASYSSSHVYTEGAGIWTIQFGSDTPGALCYIVSMDSISGKVSYLTKYYYHSDPTNDLAAGDRSKDAILPAQYEEYREQVIEQAGELMRTYLLEGREVLSVKATNVEKEQRAANDWARTGKGFAPDISIYYQMSDGETLQFTYSTHEGFLKEIYFNQQTSYATSSEEQAEGSAIEEFDYEKHWELTPEENAGIDSEERADQNTDD